MAGRKYEPGLTVYLDGAALDRQTVIDLSMDDEHELPSRVTLTLLGDEELEENTPVGTKLEVRRSGRAGTVSEAVFHGEVVSIEPGSSGGQEELVLRAFDRQHRMTRGRKG